MIQRNKNITNVDFYIKLPCSSKKKCNRNFDTTFLILIRSSCALESSKSTPPRVFEAQEHQKRAFHRLERSREPRGTPLKKGNICMC